MFRTLSLSKGKGTFGKCGATIERGRACWGAKRISGTGYNARGYWVYRCFGCVPRLTPAEQVA